MKTTEKKWYQGKVWINFLIISCIAVFSIGCNRIFSKKAACSTYKLIPSSWTLDDRTNRILYKDLYRNTISDDAIKGDSASMIELFYSIDNSNWGLLYSSKEGASRDKWFSSEDAIYGQILYVGDYYTGISQNTIKTGMINIYFYSGERQPHSYKPKKNLYIKVVVIPREITEKYEIDWSKYSKDNPPPPEVLNGVDWGNYTEIKKILNLD